MEEAPAVPIIIKKTGQIRGCYEGRRSSSSNEINRKREKVTASENDGGTESDRERKTHG